MIELIKATIKELERMESMEVIERLMRPTEWCSGVAPKSNGMVRLCMIQTAP